MKYLSPLPLVALLLAGCHTDSPGEGQKSMMTSAPGSLSTPAPNELLWQWRDASVAMDNYNAVIVEKPVFQCEVEPPPSPEEQAKLAALLQFDMNSTLLRRFQPTNTPGPQTLRVRLALSECTPNKPLLNVRPMTQVSQRGSGDVIMECEVVDSVTGVRVASLMDSRRSQRLSLDNLPRWGTVRDAFTGWSNDLYKLLTMPMAPSTPITPPPNVLSSGPATQSSAIQEVTPPNSAPVPPPSDGSQPTQSLDVTIPVTR